MTNRAGHRARGKRERYREAVAGVAKIIEADAKGLSPAAIANTLPISERGVRAILRTLNKDEKKEGE